MSLYHTNPATQQRPRQTILALIFAIDIPAGNTEMLTEKVTMAIVTKQLVEGTLPEDDPFS
jgi:hypothetical protein